MPSQGRHVGALLYSSKFLLSKQEFFIINKQNKKETWGELPLLYRSLLGEEGGDLYILLLSCLDDICYYTKEM